MSIIVGRVPATTFQNLSAFWAEHCGECGERRMEMIGSKGWRDEERMSLEYAARKIFVVKNSGREWVGNQPQCYPPTG